MGCNIPRPWLRPPTPSEKEFMEKVINEPLKTPNELRALAGLDPIDEPILKAFDQFHEAAHDLTYHDTDLDQKIKERRTNCPNCCAIITGPICEYCGTRFPEFEQYYQIVRAPNNQEIVIPIKNVGADLIGEIVKHNPKLFRSGNPAADVVAPPLPTKKQR